MRTSRGRGSASRIISPLARGLMHRRPKERRAKCSHMLAFAAEKEEMIPG
jgi:hypothetical protein